MLRSLLLTLLLANGLTCMAGTDGHFLSTLGTITLRDRTNQVSVTASRQGDKPGTVSISWPGYNASDSDLPAGEVTISQTMALVADGWFVFAEHATLVLVFDGSTLTSVSHLGKLLKSTVISSSQVEKLCPKKVRDALPKSFRKN